MAYTYLGVHGKAGGQTSATVSGLDTSGANLIIIAVAWNPGTDPAISDNKSNSYGSPVIEYATGGSQPYNGIWILQGGTVGSGHDFTATSVGGDEYPGMCVAAFAGSASNPLDQTGSGANTNTTIISSSSVTPSEANELLISSLAYSTGTSNDQISALTTPTDNQNFTGGVNYGCCLGYLINPAQLPATETWTWTGNTDVSTTIATFKVAAIVASTKRTLPYLGAG